MSYFFSRPGFVHSVVSIWLTKMLLSKIETEKLEDCLDAKEHKLNAKEAELDAKEDELNAMEYELDVKEDELIAKEEELDAKEEELNAKKPDFRCFDIVVIVALSWVVFCIFAGLLTVLFLTQGKRSYLL